MSKITDLIKPIKLLQGSHPDTAQTGSGCFMNTISYLNGDEKITDRPACVDNHVRVMMININDGIGPDDRQRLLPFVHRAMRTVGSDKATSEMRITTMGRCTSLMQAALDSPLREAVGARVHAPLVWARASFGAGHLYEAACYVGDALRSVLMTARVSPNKAQVTDILLQHIDKILPPAEEPSGEVLERAEKLVATAAQHKARATV